jgi:hypothetical protein
VVEEGIRRVSENPNVLIAEVTKVVTDSEKYLEAAEELVVSIPARRRALMERIAAAEERSSQACEKYRRVWHEEVDKWEERELEEEWQRASGHVRSLQSLLGADDLDPENRKSVARQLAGLVREDAERRLRDIIARSDDPEVRRTVAECRDEVATSTFRFMRRFAEARSLVHEEVRTTRAEAHDIFDRLRNPPVDRSPDLP